MCSITHLALFYRGGVYALLLGAARKKGKSQRRGRKERQDFNLYGIKKSEEEELDHDLLIPFCICQRLQSKGRKTDACGDVTLRVGAHGQA